MKNNKKENKIKAKIKRKGKLATGSIQQSSYTGGEFVDATPVEPEPQIENPQKYSGNTSNGRNLNQLANDEKTYKMQAMNHLVEKEKLGIEAKKLAMPNISHQYLPMTMAQTPYYNGMLMSGGNPLSNYVMLNSPILNAYHMNEQVPRQSVAQATVPEPRVAQERKKPPFTRACTHIAIAYYINFTKEKEASKVH